MCKTIINSVHVINSSSRVKKHEKSILFCTILKVSCPLIDIFEESKIMTHFSEITIKRVFFWQNNREQNARGIYIVLYVVVSANNPLHVCV